MLPKILAAAIFLTAYVLIIWRKGHPLAIVWGGAALLLVLRTITPMDALLSLNPNVIGILLGTMGISALFIHSQVPAFLAAKFVERSKSVAGALLAVCILSGVVSAVVDNVATVLMIAPIAIAVAKRLKVSPVSFLIGIAVAANLEGAATLVGDSTSILLGSAAKMSFNDFIWMQGKPGIFFSVQFGALAAFTVLYWIFRRNKGKTVPVDHVEVTSWMPTILMTLMMTTMALSSALPNRPEWTIGAIALAYGMIGLVWNAASRFMTFNLLQDIDWSTIGLLCGLFVLIGSLTTTGIVQDIANLISRLTQGNLFLAYNILVWMSVICSAFVDNIPYTMAMLPVAQLVATNMGVPPYMMMFGLMLGTTLGGNITPIGASANVVAVSMLRKEGHSVSFGDFVKVGLPFTVAAVIFGSLLNWFIWM